MKNRDVGDLMARPVKKGLSYFPKDVDFYNDYKIMDLLEKYGPIGVTVYDVILTEIYRHGYYLEEPIDRVAANIVRIIGSKWVQKRLVSQVILDCGELGLFERNLLEHGVMTSVGIQRRYSAVTSRSKASKEKYWLIDKDGQPLLSSPKNQEFASETEVFDAKTEVKTEEKPQKESKGKETKQNKKICQESQDDPDRTPIFRLLMLNGEWYPVYQEEINQYRNLYPAIDVEQEYRNMIGWIDSHPNNRKTPNGMQKFINGWLSRAQDSARPEPHRQSNRFRNFEERKTDYDAIIARELWEK